MTLNKYSGKLNLLFAIGLYSLFPCAYVLQFFLKSNEKTLCFFRSVTGIECPFCGLTRAFAAACTFHFNLATIFHPAWWLAASAVLFYGTVLLSDALLKTSMYKHVVQKAPLAPYVVAGIVFAVGVLRYFTP